MELKTELKLCKEKVLNILEYFDDSFEIPLHTGLDFTSYSKKLSNFAQFVIAYEDEIMIGFISYYLNDEKNFVYIPLTCVHKNWRHKKIGHSLFESLYNSLKKDYRTIDLEVLKNNENARRFYEREGFSEVEDHKERLLLRKYINRNSIQ